MRLGIAHEQCCANYQKNDKDNSCHGPRKMSGQLIAITVRIHGDDVLYMNSTGNTA
jgi:hypothetical protein